MSATPFGMIPVPLQDAMEATADNGGVPCGCRWNLDYTGVFLCSYHHGMFDGFNLAQEAAKSLKDETLRASTLRDQEIRIAAIEAYLHGGPLPALGITAQTILATAKYQEANREH